MTILTIESPVRLHKTHFRDVNEIAAFFVQWQFEDQLKKQTEKARNISENQLMDF